MTEEQQRKIDFYIPSPKDTTLSDMEYYVMDKSEKVQKGWIATILCHIDRPNTYELYNKRGLIGEFSMSQLYDNKDDCRAYTHLGYENWEYLRRMQQEKKTIL